MFGEIFLKCICAVAFLGLAAVAAENADVSKLSVLNMHKPEVSDASATPFWANFCSDRDDFDSFPVPDSCKDYLMCWNGKLWELTCPDGMLFDMWRAVCDLAKNVVCDSHPDEVPEVPDQLPTCPPGLFGRQPHPELCNSYVRCSNGSRTVERCPFFHDFDADLGRCRLRNLARCVAGSRRQ